MDREQLEVAIAALQDAGAEGIWLLHHTNYVELRFDSTNATDIDSNHAGEVTPDPGVSGLAIAIKLETPHEVVMLVRFPAGDANRPPSIEYR